MRRRAWWEEEIRRAPSNRDCLTGVLSILFVAFAVVAVLVATSIK